MNLTFHIIYTPGSVEYLSLFVLSLLKWADCSFRLISNGCTPEEIRILKSLCRRNPRLEYNGLRKKSMIQHCEALTILQSREQSEYFCFMDPDILAVGDFPGPVIPSLNTNAGVFSCASIWSTEEEQVLPENSRGIPGRANRTKSGICLGSTYFAIYNNTILTRLIQSTGVNFGKCSWEQIPAEQQALIAGFGLKRRKYDTGKVLNLLLLAQRESLVFKEIPTLQHIGGISAFQAYGIKLPIGKPVARNNRASLHGMSEKEAHQAMKKIKEAGDLQALYKTLSDKECLAVVSPPNSIKFVVSRYIIRLFTSLFEDSPLPEIPEVGHSEIEGRIRSVTANIVNLYDEFGEEIKSISTQRGLEPFKSRIAIFFRR